MQVKFKDLTAEEKSQVEKNLEIRKARYEKYVLADRKPADIVKLIIVGDRPGPAAPKDPSYHHTPFYSTKHCSGWLNALLLKEGIDESDLLWINAFDKDGNPSSHDVLELTPPDLLSCIIALGNNASRWLKENGWFHFKIDHPQFHKRFKNSERYELPDLIRSVLEESKRSRFL
jgi:hypothetical protein